MIDRVLATVFGVGCERSLSILTFHRVRAVVDPLFPEEPDAARFGRILDWLKRYTNVVPLEDGVARLKGRSLPPRATAITFDDGYTDNLDVALPLLAERALPATLFVATGFLHGGMMWNDMIIESIRACRAPTLDLAHLNLGTWRLGSVGERRTAIDALLGQLKYRDPAERVATCEAIMQAAKHVQRDGLMLGPEQVKRMREGGIAIGAHTVSHPILARLSTSEAYREIAESKATLESLLGERVGVFAYPNGKPGTDYGAEHVRLLKDLGFVAAVSTRPGVATADADVHQLPRFTPWANNLGRFGAQLVRNVAAQADRATAFS